MVSKALRKSTNMAAVVFPLNCAYNKSLKNKLAVTVVLGLGRRPLPLSEYLVFG